jgi:hypothetical protein
MSILNLSSGHLGVMPEKKQRPQPLLLIFSLSLTGQTGFASQTRHQADI